MTIKLHLETIGNGPPLVMLHGWGWHSGIWEPLIPILSKNFRLFLIDLPGFGKSPILTSNYDFESIAPLIFDVVPEQAAWLGWSLGGMLAWWVAIHYPEKVTRLITVASSPKFVSDENWPGVTVSALEKFSNLLGVDHIKTLKEFLELQLRGGEHSYELLSLLQNQLLNAKMELTALFGGLQLLRELDLRNTLNKMKIPSLHLFGSHDTLVPASIADRLQSMLPYGKCEIVKRAGHMPFLSHTEVFTSLLCMHS